MRANVIPALVPRVALFGVAFLVSALPVVLPVAAAPVARAADAAFAAGDEGGSLPDTLRLEPYLGKLRQLRVTMTGPDGGEVAPPPFLFDTGGGFTLFTPNVAAAVGCEPFGAMTGFRHNGDRVTTPKCGLLPFMLEGHALETLFGVFDLQALLPPGLPPLGGVLSLHTFRGRKVTLDLGANALVLESDASFAERTRAMSELHARLETEGGGEGIDLFVEVAAMRGTLWLLVDSGNMVNVLLAPHALRQLGFETWAAAVERDSLPGPPREVTLELLGYGPLTVNAQAMPELIHDGMLDAATLERLVLAMDLTDGRTWAAAKE